MWGILMGGNHYHDYTRKTQDGKQIRKKKKGKKATKRKGKISKWILFLIAIKC